MEPTRLITWCLHQSSTGGYVPIPQLVHQHHTTGTAGVCVLEPYIYLPSTCLTL